MAKELLTDEQIEAEIERLKNSEAVKLAKKEQQYKNRRRQYMYVLRWYERRGEQLLELGYSMEDFTFAPTENIEVPSVGGYENERVQSKN